MMICHVRPQVAGIFCLALLFLLSCSGGGGGNPIAPASGDTPRLTDGTETYGQSGGGPMMWGTFDVVFDEASNEFTILPLRGAQFTFNIVEFLQPPSGNPANLKIVLVDKTKFLSEGKMTLDLSITHPFSSPKLVGFDTMGVLIGDGSTPFNGDAGATLAAAGELTLINADGYTRWMNPLEFTQSGLTGFSEGKLGAKGQTWTATVNGYKYFADGLQPTQTLADYLDANSDKRGSFLPSTTNTRRYEIQFPMVGGLPVPKFQYGILTNFKGAKDDNGDPIPNPTLDQFPPAANAQEAICIIPDTAGSTLYHDDTKSTAGGDLVILLKVYDWQGMESLGGTGAFDQIDSVGLSSQDGLFSGGGQVLDASALAGTQTSAGPNYTNIEVTVTGLQPAQSGPCELLLAIYNDDPATYGPNFGAPYPAGAKLGGYARVTVNVSPTDPNPPANQNPVIDEIQGPGEVTCFDADTVYTCIAHDPDAGDTVQYQAKVQPAGIPPLWGVKYYADNTITADWGDDATYPEGDYEVWFSISDGKGGFAFDKRPVTKSSNGIIVDEITAADEDINGVECTNIDAVYSVTADGCHPELDLQYRFLRGSGTPPSKPDALAPGWTPWSDAPSVIYNWAGTEIGAWWIVSQVRYSSAVSGFSPFLIITRIDTPPSGINPPSGDQTVDCTNHQEQYLLTGGVDCDTTGTVNREWTLTETNVPPTAGWVQAPLEKFYVNWEDYPVGTYYLWQRVATSVSEPLTVQRLSTAPDAPSIPSGKAIVTCQDTAVSYDAGDVTDCEGDPVQRQWGLNQSNEPPTSGWTAFTGVSFSVDYSSVPSATYWLFQRASDNGGTVWVYSQGMMLTKSNSAPNKPAAPVGATEVTCLDNAKVYDAGDVEDCDSGDTLTRQWGVSPDPFMPPPGWTSFTGTSFEIDWSDYSSSALFVYQRVSDGHSTAVSNSLGVIKSNTAPEVAAPAGPSPVDCTFTHTEYMETLVFDCDTQTQFVKGWYLSTDPDAPVGGMWTPYTGTSFFIDFSAHSAGNYYLFLSISDGQAETVSDPLYIVKLNSAPNKPATPSGPTEISCTDNPASYNGGLLSDCDTTDLLTRYYYLPTNSVTPTGGSWHEVMLGNLLVDFTGVTAEQPYYLFQKASDGSLETISDSLAVMYHNTSPAKPVTPSGATAVSCANDQETYQGGAIQDCDTWQTSTRQWAVNSLNFPPAAGWTAFSGTTFNVDWSLFSQGGYYLFQRANDGFGEVYSDGLSVTVGSPSLTTPSTPSGPTDLLCDGPMETYDAGEYLSGCPGLPIVREWAVNSVPTPPNSGWTVFTGTSFDIIPEDLGIGNRYIYQRATLDAQTKVSSPLLVTVHAGVLGIPPTPSGSATVDCESTAEPYQMGDVYTSCDNTPLTREWQIQTIGGSPLTEWTEFTTSPVLIDWTVVTPQSAYHLVQRASDSEHTEISDPLMVSYTNDEPSFLGTISGNTNVTCTNSHELYTAGDIADCDSGQNIVREWAWNSINAYPIDGWTVMVGSSFNVDYSDSDIAPGDVYLFQRASDGIVTSYDPSSLHVDYQNTPPDKPISPSGVTNINCTNLSQDYSVGQVSDCDNTPLGREWAMNTTNTPPATGWSAIVGTSFHVDWTGAAPGTYYLFQSVSDGEFTTYSNALSVTVSNSAPTIDLVTCVEGDKLHRSDGLTTGITGLDFVKLLHFNTTVNDCDGDSTTTYWAVRVGSPPPQGDPSWQGPVIGGSFTVDLGSYTSLAPGTLFLFVGSSDGSHWVTKAWTGTVNMWKRLYFSGFDTSGDMWTQDACVTGVGSYNWNWDASGLLGLSNYGSGSSSGVWSNPITFPSAPTGAANGVLFAYVNPALASGGLDNSYFSFLRDSCAQVSLSAFTGNGCGTSAPELKGYTLNPGAPIWNNTYKLGVLESGLTGCPSSDFWVDWAGIWIKIGA